MPCYACDTIGTTEYLPHTDVDSVLSDLDGLEAGLDGERDVEAPDDPVMCGRLKNSDTMCSLMSHLIVSQKAALVGFGDTPCTYLMENDIEVGDTPPIKQRFYHCLAVKHRILAACALVNDGFPWFCNTIGLIWSPRWIPTRYCGWRIVLI